MTETLPLQQLVLSALDDMKARDVSTLDVRSLTSIADTMIVASGTSGRHVKALADHVAEQAKKAGYAVLGMEGEQAAEWVLVDLGDVIVHVMQGATREYYDIERLWKDLSPATRHTRGEH